MNHPLEEPQDRRAKPVITLGQLGIGAIGGEQELGQVIGADRQEAEARQQHVEHLGQRGDFEHRAEMDALGQQLLLRAQIGELFVEHRLGRIELPWLGDHREHDIERAPGRGFEQRARLHLHQPFAFERESQRAPAHRRVLVLRGDFRGEIGHRLVAADIHGAEDHRLLARRVEHIAIEARLALALRQGGGNEELEFGAEQADPVGAGHRQRAHIVAQAGVDHHLDAGAAAGEGLDIAQRRIGRLLLAALGKAGLEGIGDLLQRADNGVARARIEQDLVTFADGGAHVLGAADHRHVHRPRNDHHMRGKRAFFEDHALQPPLVIFEQFSRAEIAGDQDGVAPQPLRSRRADLPCNNPQQTVRQIFQIVHPVRQQRIVDLAHAHAGVLLHALDRGFGGQAGIDRLVDAPRPSLVIGEHLVGLEHLLVLAADAEFSLAGERIDLLAHLVEGTVDPLALGLGILGHDLRDLDPWLVEHGMTSPQAFDEREAGQRLRTGLLLGEDAGFFLVDQFGIGDQFGQDHRGGLQGLDLDLFVAARLDMLDAQDAHRALAVDNRDARKGMELFLAGFGAILEVGMRLGLGKVQGLDLLRNRARQPFANRHAGDVHRALVQAAGGEQLEHAFAQQVDRAHFARQAFADDLYHLIELGLRVHTRSHDLGQAGENLAGGCGCTHDRAGLFPAHGKCKRADNLTGLPLPPLSVRAGRRRYQKPTISSFNRNFCFLRAWIVAVSGTGRASS